MPHYRLAKQEPQVDSPPLPTAEIDDFNARVANLSALLQQFAITGKAHPTLITMGLVSRPSDE